MAPRNDFDLNNEANDDLDTTLCMGKDKGKRPIEESPEKPKKRKRVSDEDMEEISTGRSSEDKIARLEKKIDHMGKQIEDLKKMAKRQDAAMTSRIDRYFYWSTHSFSMQSQRSVDCMTALYNSLYEIAQAMGPRNGQGARNDQGVMVRFNNPGNGAPSTSRRPPRP